jgi:hypothetical protein
MKAEGNQLQFGLAFPRVLSIDLRQWCDELSMLIDDSTPYLRYLIIGPPVGH